MNTKRRLAVAALVLTAVVALTGCAQSHHLTEADYAQMTRHDIAYFAGFSDAHLRTVGKAVCGEVRLNGKADGFHTTADTLVQGGLSNYEAGEFVQIAVDEYCPELQSYLPTAG